jgi:hypothetical protein
VPKGRSIERPLLINGYASSGGLIGNDCEPTQTEPREEMMQSAEEHREVPREDAVAKPVER